MIFGLTAAMRVVVHLELEKRFLPVVGQEHIGVFDHVIDDLLTSLIFEVDRDSSFASIVEIEARVHLRTTEGTGLITGERLDFDHVGATVAHHRRSRRDRHHVSYFYDLHTIKYSRHAYLHLKSIKPCSVSLCAACIGSRQAVLAGASLYNSLLSRTGPCFGICVPNLARNQTAKMPVPRRRVRYHRVTEKSDTRTGRRSYVRHL